MNIPIEQFIPYLEQILEIEGDKLSATDELSSIPEFDSMGRLSVILMCDSRFGFVINVSEMDACVTISDFHALVERKATRA